MREALDQILAAIPALHLLRDNFDQSSLSSGPSQTSSKSSGTVKYPVNPVATRPAAAWADVIGLGTVSESAEYGVEDGEERKARRRSRGCVIFDCYKSVTSLINLRRRRSGVGSVAASRSPLPLSSREPAARRPILVDPIPQSGYLADTTSPSPQPRSTVSRSPNTGRKHKRRRESGLLLPQSTELATAQILLWNEKPNGPSSSRDEGEEMRPQMRETTNGRAPASDGLKHTSAPLNPEICAKGSVKERQNPTKQKIASIPLPGDPLSPVEGLKRESSRLIRQILILS